VQTAGRHSGRRAATPATVTAFSMSSHIVGYARITATAQR
jgi:hypothetical protein